MHAGHHPASRPPARDPIATRPVTPGEVVLREFTLAELAGGLDIAESTAWRWGQARPKGTGGVVPSGYHVTLLTLARKLGRRLSATDLVLGRFD